MPFLEDIEIAFIEPYVAHPGRVRLYAEPPRDLAEVLPYLNAVINHATYSKDRPSLTFMKEFRLITIYPRRITMSKAQNTSAARRDRTGADAMDLHGPDRQSQVAPKTQDAVCMCTGGRPGRDIAHRGRSTRCRHRAGFS